MKTGFVRWRHIFSKVCPCALLIVIAKANLRGNCRCVKVKGKFESDGVREIWGIRTVCGVAAGVFQHSCTLPGMLITVSLVPSQRPLASMRFLRSMTTEPFLILSLCGGMPVGVRLLRNSLGKNNLSRDPL